LNEPAFLEGRVEEALRSAYQRMDQVILEKAIPERWKDGSTGVLILVMEKKLYVSNVGDSEAVLGRRKADGSAYEPVLLTEKHLPTLQSEKTRIEGAWSEERALAFSRMTHTPPPPSGMGGFIFKGRVFGTLAVSRALGDCSFKNPNYVSSEPAVRALELTCEDRFFIVACDGLWDKISYAEAVQLVGEQRRAGQSAAAIADMLTKEALRRQSLDNVSAIVVFLQWE
jgi:serine/threonine protein phosphatase PrpC